MASTPVFMCVNPGELVELVIESAGSLPERGVTKNGPSTSLFIATVGMTYRGAVGLDATMQSGAYSCRWRKLGGEYILRSLLACSKILLSELNLLWLARVCGTAARAIPRLHACLRLRFCIGGVMSL